MIGDIFILLGIYAFIGFMVGLMSSMVYMEMDLGRIQEHEAAITTGVLWPITVPILLGYGVYKCLSVTKSAISGAFAGVWTAYVDRVEEKVK